MASAVVDPSFYADFGALSTLGKQAKQNDPQALREAARQFESLFTDMMLKSMRAAKLGDDMGESQESDFYQDMYDQQLAVQMSQGKGLGLAQMLVQQLTRSSAGTSAASASAAGGAAASGTVAAASDATVEGGANAVSIATAFRRATPTQRTGSGAGGSRGTKTFGSTAGSGSASTPAGTSAGAASLRQRIGFVQKIAPYAQRAAATLGVSADTLIAQAALETGWGQHVVSSTAGASSNNLFGIKAAGRWQGATASAATTEYSGGSPQRVQQAFRSYASVQQGVNDYVSLLQGRSAYAAALGSGADPGAFASALQRGGYATDPDYVHKLVATTASVRSLRSLAGDTGSFKLLAGVPIKDGEEPA